MHLIRIISASILALAATAFGQQVPPAETGPTQVNCRLVNGALEMRDAATGAYLMADQGLGLLSEINKDLVSEITLQAQPTGADLIFTLRNPTNQPKAAGSFNVGILNLGRYAEYFDFRKNAIPRAMDATTFPFFTASYPGDAYAPVMVLRNTSLAFGVSLQYPIMEYKHDVNVGQASPPANLAQGPVGRGYMVGFQTSNRGGEAEGLRLRYENWIPPGETRTYVISIRITRDPANWVTTLLPYRNYFRSLYGGVQYQRRNFPVRGSTVSMGSNTSTNNPFGYDEGLRPDLNGWGSYIDRLNATQFKSTMIWAISGWYKNNTQNNYPFLVASPLRNNPKLATAFDPVNGLRKAGPSNNRELGIWWGRALQLCHNWDTNEAIPFDPANPTHQQLMLREMEAIHDLGATCVGLDTFDHSVTPIWKSIGWLRDMQARFPDITYVTEPKMCDIMHTIAGTYVDGILAADGDRTVDDLYKIKGPNILADFLVPGHETWVSLSYAEHRSRFHFEPNAAYVEADMRRMASWGFVPLVFWDLNCPPDITVAKSWETSVPQSIVTNDPYMAALRAGRLPRYAPPALPPVPSKAPSAPTPAAEAGSGTGSGGSGSGAPAGNGKGKAESSGGTQLLKPPGQHDAKGASKAPGATGTPANSKPTTPAPTAPAPKPMITAAPKANTGNGAGPAPNQPPIAITVTERFNRKSKNPKLNADRTQRIMDLVKKNKPDQQAEADDDD